jgi:hypothetical protein
MRVWAIEPCTQAQVILLSLNLIKLFTTKKKVAKRLKLIVSTSLELQEGLKRMPQLHVTHLINSQTHALEITK